jgi:2-polyprenyl-3-methyl-5-hydroxy-6-metoxy-1,4-benzoquinol methylase
MNLELLEILRCPNTGQRLIFEEELSSKNGIVSGCLMTEDRLESYPIRSGIPRFVKESNYADNFGMQWNHFQETQLDSHSGHPISGKRFYGATGWAPEDLKGKWVLDVGCGAGRFAEVALEAGAKVVALDFSSAVDVCYTNLKHHPNLHVLQGDVYHLPLLKGSFSFVYSLGMLQHTPDVEKSFSELIPMLWGGGRLCVDYYERTWKSFFLPKYWFRPFTKRIPQQVLFSFLKQVVPFMLLISRGLGTVPVFGKFLKRMVPVANYYGIYPLSKRQQEEWSLLDTFDMLSPQYDSPQTVETVSTWIEQADLEEIEILRCGHLVVRGKKRI